MSRKSEVFFYLLYLLGRKINVVLNNVTGCDNKFSVLHRIISLDVALNDFLFVTKKMIFYLHVIYSVFFFFDKQCYLLCLCLVAPIHTNKHFLLKP